MLADMSNWTWVVIVVIVLAIAAIVVLYLLAKFSMFPRFSSGPNHEPPPDPKAGVAGRIRDQTHRLYPDAGKRNE